MKVGKADQGNNTEEKKYAMFVDVTHLGIVNEEVGNASDSSDK